MIYLLSTFVLIIASFSSLVDCHIKLQNPVPYSGSTLQLDPLRNAKPGSPESDFPCQLKRIGGADPFEVDEENELIAGEPQTMTFQGSASHGGGSCQLSVTLDRRPTADSTFKTIASWIGGCPIDSASGGTEPWNYTIPSEVPNGKATLAWTWVSKLSGQPEFYMNCAPITVSGGADDTTEFDQLENLFRVNLPSSECGSQQSSNLEIPNPGRYVTTIDRQALLPPTGSGCAAIRQATNSNPPSSSSQSTVVTPLPTTSTRSIPTPIFGNSTSYASATTYPTSRPTSSTIAVNPSTITYTNSTSCVTDGALICNNKSQFGLCDHGQVVWQPVAPGTSCINGQIVGIDAGVDATPCSPDGALVCNGSDQWGLCNFGTVLFQPVAAGTTCQDGQILKKRHLHRRQRHRRGG